MLFHAKHVSCVIHVSSVIYDSALSSWVCEARLQSCSAVLCAVKFL
jgi:hypothetical protein